jgi:type IV fimbrial biogenesis protein FimT
MLKRPRGFTLLELLVAMVVFAILVALGFPAFSAWIHDEQIRSTAELLQNGLRLAQTDALDRSRIVVFSLSNAAPALSATPAANGVNWYAQALPLFAAEATLSSYTSTAYLQGGALGGANNGTTITGPASVCFSSIGRFVATSQTVGGASYACSVPASGTLVSYDVANSLGDRPLRVTVSFGGQIRLCDPARTLSASNPDGC